MFSNGPRWRTLRNFALGVLREFGVGTRTIEDRILEEAACLLDKFQAEIGAAGREAEVPGWVAGHGGRPMEGLRNCFGCNADPRERGGGGARLLCEG